MTSLVLVSDFEGKLTTRALARAGQWLCPILLVSVEVMLILLWWTTPGFEILLPTFWLALVGVGVMTALRAKRVFVGLGALVVASGGGTYVYAISLSAQFGSDISSDSLLLTLPKVAAVVAGVGGRTVGASLSLSSVGFVLTGAASIVAARHTDMVVVFDVTAFMTFIVLTALMMALWVARRGVQKNSTVMNRAGLAEQGSNQETKIAFTAASVLHDTILSDLQSLAHSPPGKLSAAQKHAIMRGIDMLSDEDLPLLSLPEVTRNEAPVLMNNSTALASTVARAESNGLHLTVSGDTTVLTKLQPQTELALTLAVEQCLVNISLHAEVNRAELSVFASEEEVTVMITDAGKGFDTTATGSERLGLRLSVQDRIQAVGGSVQLWSHPGAGTAVQLTVPAGLQPC